MAAVVLARTTFAALLLSTSGCSSESQPSGKADPQADAPYTVRMFPKGETAISGVWVEPLPRDARVPPDRLDTAPQEPLAYVVQDSDCDPALVAVFGLGDPEGPRLFDSLWIEDPGGLIGAAVDRAFEECGAGQDSRDALRTSPGLRLDLEGIAAADRGVRAASETPKDLLPYRRDFWVVCEGKGRLEDGAFRKGKGAFRHPNLLLRLVPMESPGRLAVSSVIELPAAVRRHQEPQGLEGVAVGADGLVYVAFQRGWPGAGDPKGHTRIGRFDPESGEWTFALYRVDPYGPPDTELALSEPSESSEEGENAWVGVSELTYTADGSLLVLERDNQREARARVQRIYAIEVTGAQFSSNAELPVLPKTLRLDLIASGVQDPRNGKPLRKPEALGVLGPHRLLLLADDDGKRGSKKGTPFFVLHSK